MVNSREALTQSKFLLNVPSFRALAFMRIFCLKAREPISQVFLPAAPLTVQLLGYYLVITSTSAAIHRKTKSSEAAMQTLEPGSLPSIEQWIK
jgi:hypothetical protein